MSGPAGSSAHVLKQKDIVVVGAKLHITVRSTKTSWLTSEQYTVCIPSIPNSQYCPVQAWIRYYERAPKGGRLPAFWLIGGIPLTASLWIGAIRLALKNSGYDSPSNYTLHSLRRGGAQACVRAGNIGMVKEAGRWRSKALYTYVPRKMIKAAPAALVKFFG